MEDQFICLLITPLRYSCFNPFPIAGKKLYFRPGFTLPLRSIRLAVFHRSSEFHVHVAKPSQAVKIVSDRDTILTTKDRIEENRGQCRL